MYLCNDAHPEICHTTDTCPVCDLRKEKDSELHDLQAQVTARDEEIEQLKERLF